MVSAIDWSSLLYGGQYQVVLQHGERVLLVHQDTGGAINGTLPDGFVLTEGNTICGLPYSGDCGDDYRKELAVTVPGGASATLEPGQTRTIGDYLVLHGTTGIRQQHSSEACGADAFAAGPERYTNITAVLRPPAE